MCKKAGLSILSVLCFLAVPFPAFAMHISEGILPLGWAAAWYIAALPFLFFGLRDLKKRSMAMPELKPLLGLAGAAVFIISCLPIPVPVAGSSSHPCGTGFAALLIGPALTAVIASISLLIQALFLAHGGLTTLGANICSLVAGAYAAVGLHAVARKAGASPFAAAFMAGVVSDWATYLFTSLELAAALAGQGGSFLTMFKVIVVAFVPTQVPLGILEGFVTAGAVRFVFTRRPSLAFRLSGKGAL